MKQSEALRAVAVVGLVALVCTLGCANVNHAAFSRSQPRSMLILPPLDNSNNRQVFAAVNAGLVKSVVDRGYYVFPMVVTESYLHERGMHTPGDAFVGMRPERARQDFGADMVLYPVIREFGEMGGYCEKKARLTVSARLFDARTGDVLMEMTIDQDESIEYDEAGPNPDIRRDCVLLRPLDESLIRRLANLATRRIGEAIPAGPLHPRRSGSGS